MVKARESTKVRIEREGRKEGRRQKQRQGEKREREGNLIQGFSSFKSELPTHPLPGSGSRRTSFCAVRSVPTWLKPNNGMPMAMPIPCASQSVSQSTLHNNGKLFHQASLAPEAPRKHRNEWTELQRRKTGSRGAVTNRKPERQDSDDRSTKAQLSLQNVGEPVNP